MTNNPYKIDGPAIISVSGGRTSGFMLRQIIDAHGGKLPSDVIAVFNNTGKEHEATLQFLHEIETRWCPIVWLEYRYQKDADRKHWFDVVDFCSAARQGEPFESLILAKQMLPNPVARICTGELKIKATNRYARSIGFVDYTRIVGLRYDEPRRVAKMKAKEARKSPVRCSRPATRLRTWPAFGGESEFDLRLPGNDPAFGNCVGCFLKSMPKLAKVFRAIPDAGEWWASQEERVDITNDGRPVTFRVDRPTYRQMLIQLASQGQLFDDAIEDDAMPCACTD